MEVAQRVAADRKRVVAFLIGIPLFLFFFGGFVGAITGPFCGIAITTYEDTHPNLIWGYSLNGAIAGGVALVWIYATAFTLFWTLLSVRKLKMASLEPGLFFLFGFEFLFWGGALGAITGLLLRVMPALHVTGTYGRAMLSGGVMGAVGLVVLYGVIAAGSFTYEWVNGYYSDLEGNSIDVHRTM